MTEEKEEPAGTAQAPAAEVAWAPAAESGESGIPEVEVTEAEKSDEIPLPDTAEAAQATGQTPVAEVAAEAVAAAEITEEAPAETEAVVASVIADVPADEAAEETPEQQEPAE
ncbi:hypothetical protein SDC9_212782 [bioreactor metagenome]|uniref:Uncharacterized protein n=1 Tax=bioreactor metagenome TaxID=1076179 RepID=A0A645K1N2_9ZZZZ